MIRLIQITDTHLFHNKQAVLLGRNTFNSLQAVVELIKQQPQPLDLIVLSGDLSQDGSKKSYQYVFEMLRPFEVPKYFLPGNHDDRQAMYSVLNHQFAGHEFLVFNHWLFIFVDSLCEGEVYGEVTDKELKRITQLIQQYPEHNLMCFIHHPPFKINSAWLEPLCLKNADVYLKTIKQHPKLRAVVSGHVHQQQEIIKDEIQFFTTPSTCIQFTPNMAKFKLDTQLPGYRYFELHDDGALKTEVIRLTDFTDQIDYAAKGY